MSSCCHRLQYCGNKLQKMSALPNHSSGSEKRKRNDNIWDRKFSAKVLRYVAAKILGCTAINTDLVKRQMRV